MFRFENPDYLYALLLLPVLLVFFLLAWRFRQRALSRLARAELLERLAPGLSGRRHWVKFGLLLLALAALTIGLANPQWSGQRREVTRRGIDLIIALDISRSMLAEDIQPNRLERAKRFAQNLVDELEGNQIGVELFACNAYLQVPMTTDYAFVNLALSTAETDQATAQGTAIGEAIRLAERSYPEESRNHRALIILTDGEDHDGTAAEAAAEAREQGLLIYSVGVGQESGSFIPDPALGGDYLRDINGEPVRTRLDPATLQAVAEAGGGAYYTLTNDISGLANHLRGQIESIEQREFEEQSFTDYDSYFQYFIALALLLLVVEYSLAYRRSTRREEEYV